MRQRGAAPFAPVVQLQVLPDYATFFHATVRVSTQPGDVFLFQWQSPCPQLALTPEPFALAPLSIADDTISASAVWVLQ
jgi:hypothetical protein